MFRWYPNIGMHSSLVIRRRSWKTPTISGTYRVDFLLHFVLALPEQSHAIVYLEYAVLDNLQLHLYSLGHI